MFRILTLISGLLGAVSVSQFPEFSQQYLQRLAGAVDELTRVVGDFDRSAEGVGMTRDQALDALQGGEFQQARRSDMISTIARADRLSADLAELRDAPPVQRALQAYRFTDPEIAAAAWKDFKPALPVTPTGAGFAGGGFVLGLGGGWGLLRLLRWPFRRRRSAPPTARATATPPLSSSAAASGPKPALPIAWLARTNTDPHKVVLEGPQTQVSVLAVQGGARLSGGGSTHGDLVMIVADGAGELLTGSSTRALEPDQLVIVPAGAAYELVNPHEAPLRLTLIEPRSAIGRLSAPPLAKA